MGNNESNTLSQEEIDKLSGNTSDNSSSSNSDKSIDINNMLSEDELNEVAENLNELSDIKSEAEISLPDEKSGGLLSQEEIDRIATESPEETVEDDKEQQNEDNKESEKEIDPKDEKDTEKEIEDAFKVKKRKSVIIITVIVFIIILSVFFLLRGYLYTDKNGGEISNDEIANDEDLLIEEKVNIKKMNKPIVKKKTDKKKKHKSITEKGIELFLKNNKNGTDELIMKSEELIVAYDMDISEENLKLCLAFDLTASLINFENAVKLKQKPNDYFEPDNLNKRYLKRLKNLGYNEEEANKFILENGKKIIEKLRERIKK